MSASAAALKVNNGTRSGRARARLRSLPAPAPRTRRYLRAGITLEGFFDELNRRGVRYAVLRWFDTLPEVADGEDIDLLIEDGALEDIGAMLVSARIPPRRQKFDVYTVSGLPGSDFRGVPYFSAALANAVLDRAVLLGGRYRVPGPQDHFDSMAYHAVYHKGERSGLAPTAGAAPGSAGDAEHDYPEVLARLAGNLGLSVPITMADLDGYLRNAGLRPPLDTLDKLATSNPWLQRRIEADYGPADAGLPGLGVFVLRQRAAHLLDRLRQELLREGLEPLETVRLDPDTAARVSAAVRGGNWGSGPFPVAGGPPVAYVVAYDLRAAVGGTAAGEDRVTAAKLAIRRRLLTGTPAGARFNPLHSSDDPRQALDYLSVLDDPDLLARCRQRIAGIRAAMVFPYPLVELLPSHRRRAVTAVVDHPEFGESVCKLFYPSAARFLAREVRARTDFAVLPEVPALLESGDNWILSPRYVDTRAHVRRRLPGVSHAQLTPRASVALAALARALHEKGAFLLDLSPANLLSDPVAGLKVIDWEFLQDFPGELPPVTRSPTVLGHAAGMAGVDVPLGVSAMGTSARTVFHPLVSGLPPRLLLLPGRGRGPTGLVTALAEVGLLVAWVRRGLRSGVRVGRRCSERTARRTVRTVLAAVVRRRSASPG